MEPRQHLSIVIPSLTEIVGNITPDQLDDPTPCATFTTRGVIEHMIGGAHSSAPAFRGATPDIPTRQDQHRPAVFRQWSNFSTPSRPPADVVAAVDTFARQAITPDMRDGDTFGPVTQPPPHANTLQRLVTYTGRDI
ncbi:MAG: maleylpyruvate isomerase N-terminal domain-containing protein [Ilumatobacteraceae bacterium]